MLAELDRKPAPQHKLEIKVARIFNAYGPGMHPDDGRVVNNFIVQALRGEPTTIFGDGTQTRSYCYVDDMVDALVRFMETDAELTGPVNIGNPAETIVVELAELVLRLTGSKSEIIFTALPENDPKRRSPDISLAEAQVGWSPSTSLEDGLRDTVTYFRRELFQ